MLVSTRGTKLAFGQGGRRCISDDPERLETVNGENQVCVYWNIARMSLDRRAKIDVTYGVGEHINLRCNCARTPERSGHGLIGGQARTEAAVTSGAFSRKQPAASTCRCVPRRHLFNVVQHQCDAVFVKTAHAFRLKIQDAEGLSARWHADVEVGPRARMWIEANGYLESSAGSILPTNNARDIAAADCAWTSAVTCSRLTWFAA